MELENISQLANTYLFLQSTVRWLYSNGANIVIILIVAVLIDIIGRFFIERSIRKLVKPDLTVSDYKEL